jgi:putative flavoprotein involved in K+ transport
VSVVVVGAGPAGLAAAACLRERGLEATLVERAGRLGEPWRGRYDRLQLHTIRRLSGLPGHPIPRSFGRWVGRDSFVEYLELYASHHGLEPRFGVDVQRIDREEASGWRLTTSAGPIDADVVVVATGATRVPWLPAWPGTFAGPLVHSSVYRDPGPYRDRDVLVVGAGNSGSEIAVDLVEGGAARVRIAVRTPPNIVRRDTLGFPSQLLGIVLQRLPAGMVDPVAAVLRRATIPDLAPYGLPRPAQPYSQFLRTRTVPVLDVGFVDAVRRGAVEVVPGVARLDGTAVVLEGGHRVEPDAVVAATGFRPGLEPLVGHLGVLDERGFPARTHPGLLFAAITVELGGLLREAGRDGRRIARVVAPGPRARRRSRAGRRRCGRSPSSGFRRRRARSRGAA